MTINAFSTNVLAKVVSSLQEPPSFLLDTFFPMVQTETTEEIHFDVDQSKPRITPFVSPLVAGKVVQDQGFLTQTFKPAYAKDKRRFNPDQPLKRRRGEQIGGNNTPMERRNAAIRQSLEDQLEMLTRREEVMAAEALRTGQVTVSGDGYPSTVVDFQRDAALTISLSGTSEWGDAGVSIIDSLENWSELVQDKSGAAALDVVMDLGAWRLARADADVKALLDTRRGSSSAAETGPLSFSQGTKHRFVGDVGNFRIWVYNDSYVDDAGTTQKLLPANTVIMASRENIEGTRCYGVIKDEKANYEAQRHFTKSWLEEDPAIRWMLMQSAPLVVPYRINATLCATVKQ